MLSHGRTLADVEPMTKKGDKKLIGVWDFDGHYTRFKSLGAKRYMVEHDDEINITVSGLNKKVCVPYLVHTFGIDVFNKFDDDLHIPAEYTGKKTHTYIDYDMDGIMTDYAGITAEYHEKSGVHLSGCDYELSLAQEYLYYIKGVRETYE